MQHLLRAIEKIQSWKGESLKATISEIEHSCQKTNCEEISDTIKTAGIGNDLLESAALVKSASAQIDVVIHAVGILVALPLVMEADEVVEYLCLGAGNTGRGFDLETNKRIAEFKFIKWQGGSESIRQNNLFIDFFNLAENKVKKKKHIYLVNKKVPLRFLRGNRDLKSVLSKNRSASESFFGRYPNLERVSDYYRLKASEVEIIDLVDVAPVFRALSILDK